MLYALLKIIVKLALKVFYKEVRVQIKGNLPATGPLIVVANHPNTFMDPIVIAAMLKQQVYFLAKGSFFKSPLAAWVLKGMNMIPIYRKEDDPGKNPDNRATFAKCYEFLAGKGTLLIFPEGTSVNERRLRQLKTGTARIALGFEAENNFEAGLCILTVGLNYSQANHFRSELFVNVDEPIQVATFAAAYQADPFKAATELTELMRIRLEAHLIVTRNEEEDRLVKQIETIYGEQLGQSLGLTPDEAAHEFQLSQGIVEAIHHFETHQPEKLADLQRHLEDYWGKLQKLNLRDETVEASGKGKQLWSSLGALLYAVVGFPVYLYGLVNNYVPYIIPSKVARLITREEVYMAPIMMVTGIFSFSLFYALQTWAFHQFTGGLGWQTVLYVISLPLSGFLVLHYWNFVVASYHTWRFRALFQRKSDLIKSLTHKRQQIIQLLQEAKVDYLGTERGHP
ncbi:MAG: lysophospholipid acyltransferase family protein [Bacteroidota bacterium]